MTCFGFCDPEGIRTLDPRLRRALLYPAELPDQTILRILQSVITKCSCDQI